MIYMDKLLPWTVKNPKWFSDYLQIFPKPVIYKEIFLTRPSLDMMVRYIPSYTISSL